MTAGSDPKRIVIMGCGRTGAALATDLSREGHEVTVLDSDPSAFRFLPDDFRGTRVVGNGIDLDVLRKLGCDKADVFVSVTRGDNRNVMAAQMARHVFGVPVVASRVFDPLREQMYRNMGLRTINPTRVQAKRLKRMIEAQSDEEANEIARQFLELEEAQ
jgi:trk system potassium uptake protein TrkA